MGRDSDGYSAGKEEGRRQENETAGSNIGEKLEDYGLCSP